MGTSITASNKLECKNVLLESMKQWNILKKVTLVKNPNAAFHLTPSPSTKNAGLMHVRQHAVTELPSSPSLFIFYCSEAGSYYLSFTDLKLMILLPHPPKFQDYRHMYIIPAQPEFEFLTPSTSLSRE